ncbi:hypothetical protein LIX60_25365 [Streptomyces sp. S07_1.15]|uniref:hypothetical protein n=1 Tax=Streptomyces sp. S07_1.15 TaxID=2873925 RepID=UPI001D1404FC|nr:hypothetical protein [Streptomyces sp. S07_1.15]MCC3654733.1 hypothetical protein [Streptomyces sp. S07_1.15]
MTTRQGPQHQQQEPPAWLEDAAHERLVEETCTRLRAAEAAGSAADAARAEIEKRADQA